MEIFLKEVEVLSKDYKCGNDLHSELTAHAKSMLADCSRRFNQKSKL